MPFEFLILKETGDRPALTALGGGYLAGFGIDSHWNSLAMSSDIRKENPMKSLASIFVCLLLATSLAHAQGVGSSGDITGTVTDSSGAFLPKVTVSVVDTQTGLKRTAVTDGAGQYRVAGLSPSTYEVSAG